jgi:hypothetical protein
MSGGKSISGTKSKVWSRKVVNMSKRKKACQRLFRELVPTLTKLLPELSDVVKCPLCLNVFDESAIEAELISIEHPLSRKLGGTVETLTCTKCNNTDGSRYDSQLVNAMRALDGLEQKAPLSGRFHNPAGHVAIDFTFAHDMNTIQVIGGKASHPGGIEAIPSMLYDGAELTFTLNLAFAPEKYKRAVIRAGYLAVFSRFGYEYVFSEGAAQVRAILAGEQPPAVIVRAVPDRQISGSLVIMPCRLEPISFYAVVIKAQSAAKRHLAVFLPGDDGTDWKILTDLVSVPRLRLSTTVEGDSDVTNIDCQVDPLARICPPWQTSSEQA